MFCEIHPPDDFPLLFYREPTAPDMTIESGELDLEAICAARIFWTTGTGLSAGPSRSATLAALRARDDAPAGAITIHDLDHRPMFWERESGAGAWAREALGHATVAAGHRDEVEVARGIHSRRRRRCLTSGSGSRASSRVPRACSRARPTA